MDWYPETYVMAGVGLPRAVLRGLWLRLPAFVQRHVAYVRHGSCQLPNLGQSLISARATVVGAVLLEDLETADLLARNGCKEGQGYYFGRPMPVEEFERKFLAQRGRSFMPVADERSAAA
jgi:hypothetical protein